jgi:hypothetical protein
MTKARIDEAMARLRAFANASGLSPLVGLGLALLVMFDVAALAFAIGAVIVDVEANAPKMDWRPPSVAPRGGDGTRAASEDVETLSRPVFFKSRRPPPAAKGRNSSAALPRSEPGLLDGVTLSAIVTTGETSRAFVISVSAPDGRWLGVGEDIDGWSVAEINSSELVLSNGRQSTSLPLYPAPESFAGVTETQARDMPARGMPAREPPDREPPDRETPERGGAN